MENAKKLEIAQNIIDAIAAAKNGITIAESISLIEKIADAAVNFVEPRQVGGMIVGSIDEQIKDIAENLCEIRIQLQAMGAAEDKKFRIDDLLSFEFELNEVPLSNFFRFMSDDTGNKKIERVSDVCKHFPYLQFGPARNIPKFDQRFIDAGAC